MTTNRNLKRRIRHRAAKTGESYTATRRQLVTSDEPARAIRVAVAQLPLSPDPSDVRQLRDSGTTVRALMREASRQGAQLVHSPRARPRPRTRP